MRTYLGDGGGGGVGGAGGTLTPRGGAVEVDSRILLVQRSSQGERCRTLTGCLADMREVLFEDWSLEGPRTALWTMRDMERTGGSPRVAFVRMKTEIASTVKGGDMQAFLQQDLLGELEFLHEVLEIMCSYDQLQVVNLSSGELVCRRIQQIRSALISGKSKAKVEHDGLFLGTSKGRFMGIAPVLSSFVADRLRDEQKYMKEKRLLADEQKQANK